MNLLKPVSNLLLRYLKRWWLTQGLCVKWEQGYLQLHAGQEGRVPVVVETSRGSFYEDLYLKLVFPAGFRVTDVSAGIEESRPEGNGWLVGMPIKSLSRDRPYHGVFRIIVPDTPGVYHVTMKLIGKAIRAKTFELELEVLPYDVSPNSRG